MTVQEPIIYCKMINLKKKKVIKKSGEKNSKSTCPKGKKVKKSHNLKTKI